MVKSVISFYPGGGGNRYFKYLQNQEFRTLKKSYDFDLDHVQTFSCRYLTEDTVTTLSNETVLTHCVNQNHIRKKLGSEVEIIFLDFPLQDCLRREWILHGQSRYIEQHLICRNDFDRKIECYTAIKTDSWPLITNFQDYMMLPELIKKELDDNFDQVIEQHQELIVIESAKATIVWHKKYYSQLPLDVSDCRVINLQHNNLFCEIMRKELSLYKSETFDLAWKQSAEHA